MTWFTLENITYNKEENYFIGYCIEGNYQGEEIRINIPEEIQIELEDGMKVKVFGGIGMTLSLPCQLIGVKEIIIL